MSTQLQAAKARAAENAAGAEVPVEKAARELKELLLSACQNGNIEEVTVCLSKNANADSSDASGTTALSLCVVSRHAA